MSDYTPTTEEIREYVEEGGEVRPWIAPDDEAEGRLAKLRGEAFDRWLAAHDAAVARESAASAWDEAVAAIFAWWSTPEDERPLAIVNPYGDGPTDEARAAVEGQQP